jgi:hypothetical protein
MEVLFRCEQLQKNAKDPNQNFKNIAEWISDYYVVDVSGLMKENIVRYAVICGIV